MSEENDLKKGLMGPLAAGLMTIAGMSPKLQEGFDKAAAGVVAAPKPVATFKPDTLHPEMHGIAFLESSYGQNMKHAAHAKGDFDTAYGPLGFKPSTAYDEFYKNKHLTKIYPDFADKEKFTNEFKTNPDFYNLVAGTHWNRLKKNTGSPKGTAFAWRWGLKAFKDAKPEVVDADDYVKKYTSASETKPWAPQPVKAPAPIKKSEAPIEKGTYKYFMNHVKIQALSKKIKETDLAHFPKPPKTLSINHHLTPETPHLEDKAHFENHINKPDHTPPVWTSPYDPFADDGWAPNVHTGDSKKSIYDFGGKKALMKAAADESDPHSHEGFSESLTQSLFHVAGERDLVQKSHLSHINGRHFLVVHMDPTAESFHLYQPDLKRDHSQPIGQHFGMDLLQQHAGIKEQAKKITLMDYLTSNADRNTGNVMVKRGKSGRPENLLAIDHGNGFETQTSHPLRVDPNEGMSYYLTKTPLKSILHGKHELLPNSQWSKALGWIHDNSAKMQQEVEKHAAAIQDPVIKQTVLSTFNAKLDHLQRMHRMIRDGFWPEDHNLANTDPSQSLVHYGYSYNENQNHPSVRPQ